MPFTLEELQTELLTDPESYGYAAMSDQHAANALNNVRASITFPRPDVTPLEILEAIAIDDFIAVQTTLMGSWLESLTQFPSIRILKDNGSDTRVMSNIMKVLKNGSASETRIRALASRSGSRAEQLWGYGSTVDHAQVAGARGR